MQHDGTFARAMDGMAAFARPVLAQEWQAIINRATPDCRILWRSGGVKVDFIDPIEYQHSLGAALSARDVLVAGEASLRAKNARAYDEALAELNRFIEKWPSHGAPDAARVTPYRDVLASASRVRLALSPFLE